MSSPEDIDAQQRLLSLHQRTLTVYLEQLAQLSSSHAPPDIIHGAFEACSHIRRIKDTLQKWGVSIEVDSNDELCKHTDFRIFVKALQGKTNEYKYISIEFAAEDRDVIFRILQTLFAIGHRFHRQQVVATIKRQTPLFTSQAELLTDYLIDFEYIQPFQGTDTFALGKEGRTLYKEKTATLKLEQEKIQQYNKLINEPPKEK